MYEGPQISPLDVPCDLVFWAETQHRRIIELEGAFEILVKSSGVVMIVSEEAGHPAGF